MKTITKKEIFKVNGHTFESRNDALDYCIKMNFAITDEDTFDYVTVRGITTVNCWNVTNRPEEY